MSDTRQHRRLVAILAADVAGYSRAMEKDESGTLEELRSLLNNTITPQVAEFGGRIFKTMGDGVLAEFSSSVDAAECAIAIQSIISKGDGFLHLRIGLHIGDVIVEGDDLFGDGVNVAARLQTIASSGGIAISEAVFRSILGKVVAVFDDVGKTELKNIREPVQVYCWPGGASLETTSKIQAGTGLPLPDKPALIVLPFLDASGAREHEDFAAGVAEDVIYGLSRFTGIDVIGRYTAFMYRGRQAGIAELRRELGVRYIVEGSVRRFGQRVRISVELTDSLSGRQIWSQRWDISMTEIFDAEDQVVTEIVAALPGQILRAEKERVRRKPPRDMTAYDHVIAGRLCHHKVRLEDNREAIHHLDKAIGLDTDYADAYAWKACALGQAVQFGFCKDASTEEQRAFAMLKQALELDSKHIECHRLLAEVCMMTDKLEQAALHNDRALSMNPVDPRLLAQKGEVLTWLGRAEEGIPWIEKAMKLDPYGAPDRAHLLGAAYHAARCYKDAVRAFGMIPAAHDGYLAETAACRARLGDEVGAATLVREVFKQNPDFSVAGYAATRPYSLTTDRDHLLEGLRLAGLPD